MISTKEYTIEEWLDVKYCIEIRARSEEEALERYFEGHYDEKRRKLFKPVLYNICQHIFNYIFLFYAICKKYFFKYF